MLYINTAGKRLLIAVRRIKKWIQPGQTIDLNTIDVRMLGANGQHMRLATEAQSEVARETKEVVREQPKKESKSKAETVPAKSDSELRKELSDILKSMSKDELTELCTKTETSFKSRDKKDDIIKKLLTSAKKLGYDSVLKKVK